MKAGNKSFNLSVNTALANAVQAYIAENRRAGRRTVSQFTEKLWISYLSGKGVKLPPLLKNGRVAK